MTPVHLLHVAATLGWPRLAVEVPGRSWSIPIEPTPDGWQQFVGWFERDRDALEAAWRALVAWELSIRADLLPTEVRSAT